MSDWFVPTVEQWQLGLQTAFGTHFDNQLVVVEDKQGTTWQDYISNYFSDYGMIGASLNDLLFWTDTEDANNKDNAYVIDFRNNHKLKFHSIQKTDTELYDNKIGVRAFIAF